MREAFASVYTPAGKIHPLLLPPLWLIPASARIALQDAPLIALHNLCFALLNPFSIHKMRHQLFREHHYNKAMYDQISPICSKRQDEK
jgi:hypothetical protein